MLQLVTEQPKQSDRSHLANEPSTKGVAIKNAKGTSNKNSNVSKTIIGNKKKGEKVQAKKEIESMFVVNGKDSSTTLLTAAEQGGSTIQSGGTSSIFDKSRKSGTLVSSSAISPKAKKVLCKVESKEPNWNMENDNDATVAPSVVTQIEHVHGKAAKKKQFLGSGVEANPRGKDKKEGEQ